MNLCIRSIQNVRKERTWRDVRKDSLEAFRETFKYLEDAGLLDVKNKVHCLVLYLVYQPRIQASLNRSKDAWNLHQIRTAGNKTPIAIYELSREKAINRGYWTGDPGDDLASASDPYYGVDGQGDPAVEDVVEVDDNNQVEVNADDDLKAMQDILQGIDLLEDDSNWGIDVYCRAILAASIALGSDSDIESE